MPPEQKMSKATMSRSSPSLAAAFNLRQYSVDRKRLPKEKSASQPHLDPSKLGQIDLIGGNGRWKQMKAKDEFQRRAIEEKARQRQAKLLEEERQRRRGLAAERRRKQAEEERRQLKADQERKEREKADKEERKRQQEERMRARREEEERAWLARQPKTCEACSGNGKCATCLGKGGQFALFLSPKVGEDTANITDFGRAMQGCDECGGCKQNIMGPLRMGDGTCAACGGHGKIWPVISPKSRTRFVGFNNSVGSTIASVTSGDLASPKSQL